MKIGKAIVIGLAGAVIGAAITVFFECLVATQMDDINLEVGNPELCPDVIE